MVRHILQYICYFTLSQLYFFKFKRELLTSFSVSLSLSLSISVLSAVPLPLPGLWKQCN